MFRFEHLRRIVESATTCSPSHRSPRTCPTTSRGRGRWSHPPARAKRQSPSWTPARRPRSARSTTMLSVVPMSASSSISATCTCSASISADAGWQACSNTTPAKSIAEQIVTFTRTIGSRHPHERRDLQFERPRRLPRRPHACRTGCAGDGRRHRAAAREDPAVAAERVLRRALRRHDDQRLLRPATWFRRGLPDGPRRAGRAPRAASRTV